MSKGLPEHREIVAIRAKPNDMLDTNPFSFWHVRSMERVSEVIGPVPQIAPKVSRLKLQCHKNQLIRATDLRGVSIAV